MPWYKAGTVSVVQNSSTVTGTNTAFAANSRVGDAFIGPDGGLYEVVNITSDTLLSISPAYQSANAAAGAYALVPVQGYVKESADALRGLSNQFGTKLAALGTTGNYEILPINKGGTGATDQDGARTKLGLGSVATESTVPINKGGTGGTSPATARAGLGLGSAAQRNVGIGSGDLFAVPAFGIGSREVIGNTAIMNSMNVWETSFGAIADGTLYRPFAYGVCMNLAFPGANYLGAQLYMGTSPGGIIGFRSGDYSGTQPGGGFNTIYHTGNTTRAADGTLKAI